MKEFTAVPRKSFLITKKTNNYLTGGPCGLDVLILIDYRPKKIKSKRLIQEIINTFSENWWVVLAKKVKQ